jgi:hypothetical protein
MVNAGTLALSLSLFMGASTATVGCGGAPSSKGDGATNEGEGGVAASLCGRAQPCGGELTGTWKMIAMCIVDPSFLGIDTSPICPTATLDSSMSRISGGLTFSENPQIYEQTISILEMPALKVTIPSSCFSAGQTCSDLDRSYSQSVPSNPRLQSASCVTNGSDCVCSFVGADPGGPWLGVYSASNGYLSLTRKDAVDSYANEYCVQGNQLHLMALGMTKDQPVLTDIVMERQ